MIVSCILRSVFFSPRSSAFPFCFKAVYFFFWNIPAAKSWRTFGGSRSRRLWSVVLGRTIFSVGCFWFCWLPSLTISPRSLSLFGTLCFGSCLFVKFTRFFQLWWFLNYLWSAYISRYSLSSVTFCRHWRCLSSLALFQLSLGIPKSDFSESSKACYHLRLSGFGWGPRSVSCWPLIFLWVDWLKLCSSPVSGEPRPPLCLSVGIWASLLSIDSALSPLSAACYICQSQSRKNWLFQHFHYSYSDFLSIFGHFCASTR